ncbi:hypothetical protein [Corynebacterium cystitidis]|uniref:Uncharacterized protein n=1 Tax=Corynebacterium cystitidis DSM 20524 TaxID=1121357 RepID=A0A1H9WKV0_9CORY|nr:hypothetical protein [Corynebacterium cystitidis]WJY83421.1 hypothetical protein CCYS_12670 [Corynebacterium cystitidis DSM 20524]SES34464.1 hypothetical protein SAMN05661109_02791 [Corynebacterium cystitidis DSM 20524]SNV61838.1 Uncharacterised protein [Corynebacterium cystitidis]
MNFTTTPPQPLEFGRSRDYYEAKINNFYFDAAPWGTSFTGNAEFEGEIHNVGGAFTDDVVTGVSVTISASDSFEGITVDVPPEQFHEELKTRYPDATVRETSYDEIISTIDTGEVTTEIFFTNRKPVTIHWTQKN